MSIIQMLVWILFSLSTSIETSVGGTARSPVTSQGPFLLITTDWGENNGIAAADTSLRPSDLNVAIWVTHLHWQDKHRSIPFCTLVGYLPIWLPLPQEAWVLWEGFTVERLRKGIHDTVQNHPLFPNLFSSITRFLLPSPFLSSPSSPPPFFSLSFPPSPSPLHVFSPEKKKIAILYLGSVKGRIFPGFLGSMPVSFVSGLLGSTPVSFVSGQPKTVHLSITISYLWA